MSVAGLTAPLNVAPPRFPASQEKKYRNEKKFSVLFSKKSQKFTNLSNKAIKFFC